MSAIVFAALLMFSEPGQGSRVDPVPPTPGPTAAEIAESKPQGAKKDEIVCRKEPTLGTRFSRKVCRKRSDMLLQEEAARNATQLIQNEKATFSSGG